jgi:PAS domain S-box-containing protein
MARGHDPKPSTPRSRARRLNTGSNSPVQSESNPSTRPFDTSPDKKHKPDAGISSEPNRLHNSTSASSKESPPQPDPIPEKLEDVLEAANIGTWEWNIQTGRVRWSRNMEKVHGQAPGSFGGTFEGFLQGVHPEDRNRVLSTIQESQATGHPYQVEYRQSSPDHRVMWMEAKGQVIFDEAHQPVKMMGVCTEVTERKRRIELLNFQADVLSQVDDVVFAMDHEVRITYWNKAAELLYGYTADEVIGRKLLDFIRFRWIKPEDEAACANSLATSGSWHGEAIQFKKNGEEVCVEASVSMVKGGESSGNSYLALLRDITKRKRAELELRKAHEGLEARVRERTGELQSAIDALQAEAEDHRRTDRALRESEQRLEMLMDSSPAIIFMKDVHGRYLYVNPEFQKLCDLDRHQIVGKTDHELFPAEQAEAFRANDLLVLQTGVPLEFEETADQSDGVHTSLVTKFPLHDTKSRVYAICGIVTDITERKRAEEALHNSEARLRAVIESMDDIAFEIDEQGTYLYVWTANERLLARPKKELIGQRLDSIFGKESTSQFLQAFKRVLSTGRHETIEYSLELPSGRRWFSGRMSPILTEDGSPGNICLVVREITDHKQSEVALKESEERFRLLLEGVKDYAVLMLSPEGNVLSWNLGAERIIGYKREEIIGKHVSVFYPPEEIQSGNADRALKTAVEEGRVEEEGWRVRKDGTRFWANVVLTALRDEAGNLRGLSKVTRDITERKKAEDSLRHLSGLLLQSQDEERRRLARELHDSTGQILSALALSLSMATDVPEANLHPQVSKAISESVDLANRACNEIRTLSYLLHPPLLDEAGLSHALRWYVNGFVERTNIHVDLEITPELGRLSRDQELALFRVVQESLTNIHRHSGSSTAEIHLFQSDHHVSLAVRDHGKGLPDAIPGKPPGTPAHFGVGIRGMHERMRQLGGRMEVSCAHPGTIVRAVLPLSESEDQNWKA